MITGGQTSKVGSVSQDFFSTVFFLISCSKNYPKNKEFLEKKSDFFLCNLFRKKYFDLISNIFQTFRQNFKTFGQKTADFTRIWQI